MTIGITGDSGAHFYRCDFQVHTPRDNQWSGDRPTDGPGRDAYAAEFVAKCREIKLDAVAITDHHDFAFFPHIKKAACEERGRNGELIPASDRVVVFPGLELTLGTPTFQAILILDADFPEDRLSDVLQALSLDVTDSSESSLPGVMSIDHLKSPLELHAELDKRPWLKGRYVLLPNVTDGGHKTFLRSGMKAAYREMPCVGGYLDGNTDKIGTGNLKIFSGQDANYGNKRIALFQTSDSRSSTFEKLGTNSTWVKWATPTAEALRQACLAQESRISQVEPELPNIVVSRIEVSNSKFLGPFAIDFNQQYNAIIGGRGTGKSTVLSYLRWALCDSPHDPADETSELGSVAVRHRQLIDMTLRPLAAVVDVRFSINGISHLVRRQAADGTVMLKIGLESLAPASEEDVRALLPVHAYNQKQLSSVAVRVDELTRFVTAPIQSLLDALDSQRDELAAKLRANYASLQRQRLLDRSLGRTRIEVTSLETQAANIRESLATIDEGDRSTLEQKPLIDVAAQVSGSTSRALDDTGQLLDEVYRGVETLRRPAAIADGWSDELKQTVSGVVDLADAAIAKVLDLLSQARAVVASTSTTTSSFGQSKSELERLVAEFAVAYDAVKNRSSTHDAKLKELNDVEKRAQERRASYERQQSDRDQLGDAGAEHVRLRVELLALAKQRSTVIEERCLDIAALSDGLISADLRRGAGLSEIKERFKSSIAGSGVRGQKVDTLFEGLDSEAEPMDTWERVLDEFEILVNQEEGVEVKSSTTPTLSRLGFPLADQTKAAQKVSVDGWLDLAMTPIHDTPSFRYRVRESEYIDFDLASAGQQATALLRVLLAQPGMPLIIDQPEDDLDSEVVVDVVTRIWAVKGRRQVIFSSHNANLVVNGDAELVIVCENRTQGDQSGGGIAHLGAIDVEETRSAITRVMEGGEGAFKLRKEKYGF